MTGPAYDRWGVTVYEGDCLDVLRQFPDGHFAAVVTDPPYNLSFMGREWDAHESPLAFQQWCEGWARECLRVLKPGGMMLSFGGTRTVHRLTCGIEDAGFEIRDSIDWLYGGGMPKGINISKAIDRRGGNDGSWFAAWLTESREAVGLTRDDVSRHFPSRNGGTTGKVWNWEHGHGICTQQEFDALCDLFGQPQRDVFEVERQFVAARRGIHAGYGPGETRAPNPRPPITTGGSDAARQWEGWNTQLRPAHEPIVVARKPFPGTVAGNVLAHGTGGINVDACRVAMAEADADMIRQKARPNSAGQEHIGSVMNRPATPTVNVHSGGRWPPNVVFSHVPSVDPATGEVVGDACADGCVDGCPVRELDQQSGITTSSDHLRNGTATGHDRTASIGAFTVDWTTRGHADAGGASRFFPCFRFEAKAPTAERPRVAGESHSTVKPLALMRWLVRLVTPPGGAVLDCFAGSGPTGQAARSEGFQAVLIDSDPAAIPWIVARLDAHPREDKPTTAQSAARQAHPDLFEGAAS